MTARLREAAQAALEALEAVAQDAYGRAGLVCCNRPGLDCCGNPAPQWTDQDAALMFAEAADRLRVSVRSVEREGGAGIALDTLRHVAERTGGRCEVSGMPFYFGDDSRHPQQPSLDRVDSSRGYDLDNVRMVCLAVNYCMSQWGERVFHAVAAAVVAKKLAEMSASGV